MSPVAFLKGFALAGVVAFGFALGLAWEHRGHTSAGIAWITGQSLRAQRDALQAEISAPVDGWSARLDTCHASVSALSSTVKATNEAMKALGDEGRRMTTESAKAVRGATQAAERAADVAREIAGRTPASPDVCASAYQLIRDYAPQ